MRSTRFLWFGRNSRAAFLLAAALFVGITGARLLSSDVSDAISFFYVLPIALVAVSYGMVAGITAGLTASLVFTLWAVFTEAPFGPIGWLTRLSTFLLLGLLLGRATDRLVAGEERFRQSIESMFDPFVLLIAVRDDAGRIVDFEYTFANDAASAQSGVRGADLVGRRLLDVLPFHRRTGLFEAYVHVVETGEPLVRDDFSYEDVRRGERVRRSLAIRAVQLGDGLACTWRDVTAKRAAEHALRARERELREAQALARAASWRWNLVTGEMRWPAEARRIHGLPPETTVTSEVLVGMTVPQYRGELSQALDDVLYHGTPCALTYRAVPPVGEPRWLMLLAEPDEEAPGWARAVVQDVTELREADDIRRQWDDARRRQREAFEINDSIVQGLAVTKWSLELGNGDSALNAATDTLQIAQRLVSDLLHDGTFEPGELRRSRPTAVSATPKGNGSAR